MAESCKFLYYTFFHVMLYKKDLSSSIRGIKNESKEAIEFKTN